VLEKEVRAADLRVQEIEAAAATAKEDSARAVATLKSQIAELEERLAVRRNEVWPVCVHGEVSGVYGGKCE
jgi:hypothetical protein